LGNFGQVNINNFHAVINLETDKGMKPVFYKKVVFIFIQVVVFFNVQAISGQEADSVKKNLKNSIKVNITNPMIFGDKCYMIGYERTIGDHQSLAVNIGRFSIPLSLNLINTDSIEDVTKNINSKGFHFSSDYRFYLSKENKYNSPHGIYIGPYVTYNGYSRDFRLSIDKPSLKADLNANFGFRIASVGFQMGYQFVFWRRVTLDMVLFGPGLAAYKIKTDLSTTLDPEQESELFQKINDALAAKIPGYDLVINPGTYERTGTANTTSFGFRYVVMLGIRF